MPEVALEVMPPRGQNIFSPLIFQSSKPQNPSKRQLIGDQHLVPTSPLPSSLVSHSGLAACVSDLFFFWLSLFGVRHERVGSIPGASSGPRGPFLALLFWTRATRACVGTSFLRVTAVLSRFACVGPYLVSFRLYLGSTAGRSG